MGSTSPPYPDQPGRVPRSWQHGGWSHQAKGRAEALFAVLEARGTRASDQARTRILTWATAHGPSAPTRQQDAAARCRLG
jgi:hypothetical protein